MGGCDHRSSTLVRPTHPVKNDPAGRPALQCRQEHLGNGPAPNCGRISLAGSCTARSTLSRHGAQRVAGRGEITNRHEGTRWTQRRRRPRTILSRHGGSAGAGPSTPGCSTTRAATRRFLFLAVAIGGLTALLLIAQAWLIADLVAGAFLDHRSLESLRGSLLASCFCHCRSIGPGLGCRTRRPPGVGLRQVGAAPGRRRPRCRARAGRPRSVRNRAGSRRCITTGIDALDGYFARYLPQLFLAVIVPVAVIAVVAGADWVSAVLIAVSMPLIPLFMALVGRDDERPDGGPHARRSRGWPATSSTSWPGLPTLKIFGRAKAQARSIADVTDRYRTTTLATLRLTFLSSLVLELLATVSVALVAVAVGLRLLGGDMSFRDALFVLVLAPEALSPSARPGRQLPRQCGRDASRPRPLHIAGGAGREPRRRLEAGGGHVHPHPRAWRSPTRVGACRALAGADLAVAPGEIVALDRTERVRQVDLAGGHPRAAPPRCGLGDPRRRRPRRPESGGVARHVAWVPQQPHLFARTVAENVRLGCPGASDAAVADALEAAGLTEVVCRLPDGVDTLLGEGGTGLSTGERQRVALARAFVRDAPSSCSTSRPPVSTAKPSRTSCPPCAASSQAALR